MLKVSNTKPKPERGKPLGYVRVYRFKTLIAEVGINTYDPLKYVRKNKTGKHAASLREQMIANSCMTLECDWVLHVGKFDERNKGKKACLSPKTYNSLAIAKSVREWHRGRIKCMSQVA